MTKIEKQWMKSFIQKHFCVCVPVSHTDNPCSLFNFLWSPLVPSEKPKLGMTVAHSHSQPVLGTGK